MKKLSVSVFMPALNEEKNIRNAINSVVKICTLAKVDYEVIVCDDGSLDDTSGVARQIAQRNKRILVIRSDKTSGLGHAIKNFISRASKTYWMFYPGDADMASWSLLELINQVGNEDLIVTYPRDMSARPIPRRLVARSFTVFLNFMLGLHLRYYTGSFISLVAPVKRLNLKAHGVAALFEFKVRLIKSGSSYREVTFDHVGRIYGGSKAYTFANLIDVARVSYNLFMHYRLGRKP